MGSDEAAGRVRRLKRDFESAQRLQGRRFKDILDAAPVAVAVSEFRPAERIVYVNDEFERLTGQAASDLIGGPWERVPGLATEGAHESLGASAVKIRDYLGSFAIDRGGDTVTVDAWSSTIEDAEGPLFRLVAIVEVGASPALAALERQVEEKDLQLRELQHRVKNNLQMITALIRAEAKGVPDRTTGEGFERLAGRVEALGVLYRALTESEQDGAVDLGLYLTQVASAVMAAHGAEGIHLDLQVDSWPVSIDVAMPLGLVVNELMTNSLKHAFRGQDGGTLRLHATLGPERCTVAVADDGRGLPEDSVWPTPGKLSSLIVRSLLQNAKATFAIWSEPGRGTSVTFEFPSSEARI
ncbi:MAG TPA: histidine kinase dimerization/phosphoacceptor domain -containing protein [Caulobacteraceae bacterium]|nr:histidine kinase dimerization/phosphoacceptor domain -containing protein [Caulobacteraceae bacterium]